LESISNLKSPYIIQAPKHMALSRTAAFLFILIPITALLSKDDWKQAMDFYVFTTFITCIVAVLASIGLVRIDFGRTAATGTLYSAARSGGFFEHFGDIAVMISCVIPYMMYSLWSERIKGTFKKIFFYITFLSIFVASIPFRSRNVWLSMAVTIICYLILTLIEKLNIRKIALALFILATIIFFGNVIIDVAREVLNMAIEVRPGTVDSRLEMIREGAKLICEAPFLGVGTLAYAYLFDVAPHNIYIAAILGAGIGGWGILLLLYLLFMRLFRKYSKSNVTRIVLSGYIGFLTAGFFYPAVLSSHAIFWSELGLVIAVCIRQDRWIDKGS